MEIKDACVRDWCRHVSNAASTRCFKMQMEGLARARRETSDTEENNTRHDNFDSRAES